MNPNERKLEELMSKMTFDDKPDHRHRDKLEQELLAAFARRQWQQERKSRQAGVWRTIMQNRPLRLAAAAAVIAVVGIASWTMFHQGVEKPMMSSIELLAKAQAAEKTLFVKTGIVHLVSEITVYPTTNKGAELIEKLGDTKKSAEEVNKINHEIFSQWMVSWLPISSLNANGWPETNRIKLSEGAQQAYIIQDESWYDAATGRFARVMETDGNIIFANSYDGSFVYQSESMNNGTIKMKSEAVAANFKAPDNPAEFLGLTAGVQQCLDEKCLRQPVQSVTNDVLTDGTKVTVYKTGFTGIMGEQNTYYLFKVRQSDEIVAEIEYITNGKPQIIIRRVLSESVEKPDYSWNLAELSNKELASEAPSAVTVASDVATPNISVRDMAERASFETYIFETDPNWTQQRMIVDVLDTMSAPKRMFVVIYKAQDKRDVILAQSETHNKYFASITKQIEAAGKTLEKIVYPNGCKLWAHAGPVAWWTDLTLRSSGIEPAANRSGYLIETPSGTILIVAVNGQLTKEEMDGLVNSVIPTKDYQVK